MNRVSAYADFTLNSIAFSWRIAWFVALGALLLAVQTQPQAHAIEINIEYTDEGDPVPHPENPSWDPAGEILKAHFERARDIWESLFFGGGEYEFDYHWDDDISGLALHTNVGVDEFIEVNPNFNWYADADFANDSDFTFTQTLYSGLTPANQSAWFPGTTPPTMLEVGYVGMGNSTASQSEQSGVTSANGYDLLTVILHEIGHALGISVIEPGEYNIYPQHVGGGLNNVLVKEAEDDDPFESHLAGSGNAPWLMDSTIPPGTRELPSATDVLVIAEDQGIADVVLARVERISTGQWSDTNGWIGGAMPFYVQDVSINHGGNVAVDVDASARSLLIAPGNTVVTLFNSDITISGNLIFTDATVEFVSTGTLLANHIIGDPGDLSTGTGSLVRFNQFTRGTSGAISATFGGSVAIGVDTDPGLGISSSTFDPNFLATWNIAENLRIGDQGILATLVVDNGTWTVGGNVTIGPPFISIAGGSGHLTVKSNAVMTVGGNLDVGVNSGVIVEETGTLDIGGDVSVGQQSTFTYKDNRMAENTTYEIRGGETGIFCDMGGNCMLTHTQGGALVFEDTANAFDATIILEGGAGENGPPGLVIFKDDTSAGDAPTDPPTRAEFRTKGGRRGIKLDGFEIAGNGGQVRFEGISGARDSTFINEGGADYFGGTGGRTVFTQNASAETSIIHNHGATYINAGGGATHFLGNSTATSATITNHADATFIHAGMESRTVFFDFSSAGNATIENEGAPTGTNLPGRTEFRGDSSAAFSNIYNRGHLTPGGLAGRTDFYDDASAGDAFIRTYEGYSDAGRIEFHGHSRAERARLIVENVPGIVGSSGNGGHIIFRDNSRAEKAQIFLRADACCNGVQFFNSSSADDAQITTEYGAGGITFWDFSKAADPTTLDPTIISLGRGSVMSFYDQSKAENAYITMSYGAQLQFNMNSSAGQAQIVAAGSSLYPWNGAAITFNSTSTVNNATVTLHGGTVPLGAGATASFINGAHAGNATITANGGTGGGGGATISFNNAFGDTAKLVANAGATVDFLNQSFYGPISFGSIEGAGTFVLRGADVTTGTRDTSTTVSGPIIEGSSSGGRLTKVGSGTLTLAGANTYTGQTKINAGTLRVTGSILGGAVVNSGGRLEATGSISGGLTVNSGGVYAPGASPGTSTIDGLTMMAGGTLNFELGDPARDHIVLTNNGNVSLAGTLNISLLDGFTPSLGQSFSLFEGSVGSISGAFDTIIAPTFNGLTFDVVQNPTSIILQVGNAPYLAGDYNDDGKVDAADYVVWRKNEGTTNTLPNDPIGGTIGPAQFNQWRAHFGQTAGSGALSKATVPEPASAMLLLSFAAVGAWRRRRVAMQFHQVAHG